jgi:hypothetical protein
MLIPAIEPQYFPCIDYIKKIAAATYYEIEQWENFQKSTLKNRCIIAGSNGLITLTVPVKGGREQKALIKDIELDYTTNWQVRHCRSIQSSYAKAAFYEYYHEAVFSLILRKQKYLIDLNVEILEWLHKALKINSSFELSKSFSPKADISNSNSEAVSENWQPRYFQVFEDKFGFQPNLSILDLLFCEGPNASNLLVGRNSKD